MFKPECIGHEVKDKQLKVYSSLWAVAYDGSERFYVVPHQCIDDFYYWLASAYEIENQPWDQIEEDPEEYLQRIRVTYRRVWPC